MAAFLQVDALFINYKCLLSVNKQTMVTCFSNVSEPKNMHMCVLFQFMPIDSSQYYNRAQKEQT